MKGNSARTLWERLRDRTRTATGGPSRAARGPDDARPTATDWPDDPRLRAFAGELVQLQQVLRIPGISVAVAEGDEVLWASGLGWADVVARTPATPATAYHLGSITKTFTAALAAQLSHAGKLDLDVNAGDIAPMSLGATATVRQFLAHRVLDPGHFSYSGSLFDQLTPVIEAAAGAPFTAVLEAGVFGPAGMIDTAPTHDPDRYEVCARLARPYLAEADRAVATEVPKGKPASAATGVISTAADLVAFSRALDGGALVPAAAQRELFTPAPDRRGRPFPYGLGWFVQEFDRLALHWHYGQLDAYSSLLLRVPARRMTFVLLANSAQSAGPFGLVHGNVMRSPFACAFARHFLATDPEQGVLAAADGAVDWLARWPARHLDRLAPGAPGWDEVIARALVGREAGDRRLSDDLFVRVVDEQEPPHERPDPGMLFFLARSRTPALHARAEAIAAAILSEAPGDVRTLFDLAISRLNSRRLPEAFELLERIIRDGQDRDRAIICRSRCVYAEFIAGRAPDLARQHLEAVLASGVESPEVIALAERLLARLSSRGAQTTSPRR